MTTQGERNLLQTVILVGTSPESWEKAAASVVEQASKTMMVVGVKVDELDTHISNGKITSYGARLKVTIKL
jgi:hypothetical protein